MTPFGVETRGNPLHSLETVPAVSVGARIPIMPVENPPPLVKWCIPALAPLERGAVICYEDMTCKIWKD